MRFEKFEKIFSDSTSKYNKIKKEDYNSTGEFPIIDQGQNFIGGFTDDMSMITNWGQPVIVFGDHTKIFKYVDFPFAIGADGVKVLTLKDPSFNTKYYYFFLRSLKLTDAGYSRHYKFLKESKLPLPINLSDQLHIANLLSKAENLISQRKQSIALLDEFLKSTFLEMFGDPVRNEKGWKLKLLSDYGKSRLGKMLDGKQIIGNNLKPYLRNSNVQWFSFKLDDLLEMDFDEKDKLEFSLKYGDILMCEGGDIGRCAIWRNQLQDCYFQKAIHRIRLNEEFVLPSYFVYMFRLYTSNGGLKVYMGAATISHLTGENLKKLRLPIPPIELQTQFAQIVEKTEALKVHYQSSLQELENLYGSLSQRAFRGELTLKQTDGQELMAVPKGGI
jgi:type I restriction enzyme S subunit